MQSLVRFFELFSALQPEGNSNLLHWGEKLMRSWGAIPKGNEINSPWTGENPEGLAIRAAAHFTQAAKITTGHCSRYELTIDYTYETVGVGVILLNWEQVCGKRVGVGMLPYWRYVTSGGRPFMRFDQPHRLSEAEIEAFNSEIDPWGVELGWYIDRAWPPERRNALRELEAAVAAIQPTIFGWIDDDLSRSVWTQGAAAQETILAAVRELQEADVFYQPYCNQIVVGANSDHD